MRTLIGYYRVSTASQWRSGLGLEAQRRAVSDYAASVGARLVAEFEEAESGRRTERPRLQEAIAACRSTKSTLVIAKLDRLARNLHFISRLLESGVEFVAADMPTANKLTIHIIAAMAEYERDLISDRTRLALKAAKSRGVKLGSPDPRRLSAQGVKANRALADAYASTLRPLLEALRLRGATSPSDIARALNTLGTPTRRGKSWTSTGVRNLLARQNCA